MHILVADDDSQLRELLAEFLRDRGHGVDTAADGREAIERLRGRLRNGIIVSDQVQGADDALARIMGPQR